MSAQRQAIKEANARLEAVIGTEQLERVGRAISSLKHALAALGGVPALDQGTVAIARTRIEEALLWICAAESKTAGGDPADTGDGPDPTLLPLPPPPTPNVRVSPK